MLRRFVFLAWLFFLSITCVVVAQTTTATISGVVKDETGAVLPGVSVTVTNRETGITRAGITDDSGYFNIPRLTVGQYDVQAELTGFHAAVITGITLQVGQQAGINPVLKVGELTEKVTVSGEAELVETTSATLSAVVDDKKIRDLPLNGRSFTQLALMQEGVITPLNATRSQIGNEGQKLSINGTRTSLTAFLIDGTDIRNQMNTTPGSVAGVMLGVDTVREFSVVTSMASVEYGLFTGGVVSAVTRSGTNQLHGSLFEFLRNSSLDARNFFDRTKPGFKRNQFGFTLGGPIQRDKTFFFGSFEGLRDRLAQTMISAVPDANAHVGILPASRGGNVGVNAAIKPYLDKYPLPNGGLNGDGTGSYFFTNVRPTNENYFMTKIDHQFSASDSFFARYTFDQGDRSQLEDMALWGLTGYNRSQFLTVEEKKIINPNLLNTARFAFNRSRNKDDHFPNAIGVLPESLKFVPLPEHDFGILQLGGLATWGPSVDNGKTNVLNKFQYADSILWTRGHHSLKFGADILHDQFNVNSTARSRGIYQFASLSALLQAQPASFDSIVGSYVNQGFRESFFGFYIQDDYRMRSNLTWNLGLRYEFFTNPTEVKGRFGNLDDPSATQIRVGNPLFGHNPSLKDFAPRIGFAWSPFGTSKTSIRGGAGMFYDLIQPSLYFAFPQFNVPFFPRVTLARPSFPDAVTSITNLNSIVPGLWVAFDPKQSYVMQYNLSIQQEIAPQTVVTVGYQGSHGTHLSRFLDGNIAIPQRVNGQFFFPVGAQRRNAAWGQMRAYTWDANSFYNAFRFGLQRRFSGGLQFQSAYTHGRSIDDSSSVGPFDGVVISPNGTTTFYEDHKFDRGPSSFDVRNVWNFNSTYELPFGTGRRFGQNLTGFAGKLVGGWQLSGIATLATGFPQNLLISFDNSRSARAIDIPDRPNLNPGASNNPVLAGGRNPIQYFDPTAFSVAPAGFLGNLGRGSVVGPGVATVDFSLVKNTEVREGTTVQFRAEMFNALNRANFGIPSSVIFTSATGPASGTAGRITTTTTTARQIQFALKIIF